ncbi:MAG TPA: isopentenyl phosphate kinase [Methanolinea sp.]|nr:isopentenyl phosphate kinase [Methanolinea sp.]HQK55554.1 isopentenyl phosphate kinase [Methanolinea sp.]
MSERLLLKLGGSVVTDKGMQGVASPGAIAMIASEIAQYSGGSLCLVHGAGSFGHPEAKRYGLAAGADRTNREGIALTHEAVCRLNQMMVGALRGAGADAVGIHPLGCSWARAGRLVSLETRPLQHLMDMGIIPVLHGDVVMDEVQGACIVSGDQIVSYLGERLAFTRVGLATDVPGVLSAGGVVIEEIPADISPEVFAGGSGHTDVTGGMAGKVRELQKLASLGLPSDIFHLSRISDFLHGRPHGGTRVVGRMNYE